MRIALPLIGSLLIASAGAALAVPPPAGAPGAPPPQRFTSLVVYGEDPCPKGSGDEIVVCARQPESDRYRIPKKLRHPKKDDAPSQAWGNRVATLDDVGRTSAGLPDTCSAVGSGGQTGCQRAFLQAARDQKKADAAEKAAIPGNGD